ncbi:MAG: CBS domain-containing protein [Planctomycetota bacterium]|nr:CBS domain-containing protein [Planctomycetota bacterium]
MTSTDTDSNQAAAARWALVTARDIMRKDVVTVNYATPLSDVERRLSDHRISGAPVTDESGHIIGVVSLKDLVERYAENAESQPRRGPGYFHLSSEEMGDEDYDTFEVPDEAEETAGDIMTGEVFSVSADAGLRQIAGEMVRHRVHRLLVEEGGKYIGLISTMEILDSLSA